MTRSDGRPTRFPRLEAPRNFGFNETKYQEMLDALRRERKMIKLIVKGNKFQAAKAAADRKLPFVFDRQHPTYLETYGYAGEQYRSEVVAWFSEKSTDIGSLLFYREP